MKRHLLFTALSALALLAVFSSASHASDFPIGSPAFITSYDAALKAARETHKPIVAIFSASWCPPCQANKKNVYPSDAVKPFHDKFVWAYLDADAEANIPAMQKFGVSGIPHIQFLDSTGKPIGNVVGGTSPKDFAKTLAALLAN